MTTPEQALAIYHSGPGAVMEVILGLSLANDSLRLRLDASLANEDSLRLRLDASLANEDSLRRQVETLRTRTVELEGKVAALSKSSHI